MNKALDVNTLEDRIHKLELWAEALSKNSTRIRERLLHIEQALHYIVYPIRRDPERAEYYVEDNIKIPEEEDAAT